MTYLEEFTILITDVNETPQITGESFTVLEGGTYTAINLLDNDSDPDPADNLAVNTTAVDDVDHGSLTLNSDGSFSYTHDSSENFSDSFEYQVCDDGTPQLCANGTVTITITPVNDNPERKPDS